MKKTIKKDGISIHLDLNEDNSVNLNEMMTVEFDSNPERHNFKAYPTGNDRLQNIGTIEDQFEYAKSVRKFNEEFDKRK